MASSSAYKRVFIGFLLVILLFGAAPVVLFPSAMSSPGQKPIAIEEALVLQVTTPESAITFSALATREEAVIIPVSGCLPAQNVYFENQVLRQINQERAKGGLPQLILKNQLTSAALAHSSDMACRGFFNHINPDGKTAFDRIHAQGYQFTCAGETIYGGDGSLNTPEQAIHTWLTSAIHKKAMLNPAYSEVGIGIIYLPGSKFGGYYTVVFANPAS